MSINSRTYGRLKDDGSVTVEAALFLPVFIIGILTIGLLLKAMYIEEKVFHQLANQVRPLAAEAYLVEFNAALKAFPVDYILNLPLQNGKSLIGARLCKEIEKYGSIDNAKIDDFNFLVALNGISDQISIRISYDIPLHMPIRFIKEFHIENEIRTRAWTGKSEFRIPMPFQEMAMKRESRIVYVFPRAGEKYHQADCALVTSNPVEIHLSDSIRRKYKPCLLCEAAECENGALIYCFSRSGNVYHTANCPIVDRYIIEMEIDIACDEGYQPCQICGGGN